ncbi:MULTISPECIES: sugar ABC transporter ATP-binding protein [unclassified Mesorhizobium]|uniref:sugar ABC transporter ATP-binding protein n=1 Tax=unclassified Mesorhizobium TaxID=325217 RepID=UPI000FD8CFDE|nr:MULTISPECIES: sugar ABC transporter ATP-binding protein [unclassified Mesorhizobium]TGQ28207.1 sugar ABC transporter ATP-binding protein [Mesorhizobium sp. M00.F.Ca.ET.216.01.1.1]TIS57857.1 MAG: ATP-binding cassette domain-containing protein [Mesorhizobium sp.]TIS90402.1 MAG: ATP-binding cassette domain-containing protein [Mesorhizobium sp.]TJW13371.1 MAG: ATP-binding cassette domain-containing protein [Mesorhizobium sp.]TJW43058.1 MAG: ATP-binding cassette domain-containing protein [Mesorh
MSAPLLSVTGAIKRFGGVQALRGVDFDLRAGEIHALLGENGAGKSTLMNLLSGVYAPDEGTIEIDGKPVRFSNPREAQAAGIATIFQELDLVPTLDVASNLFLGRELMRPGGFLDAPAMRREAGRRLEAIELAIDPARLVADLSIGQRQVVAIVKALSYASRVLIMDEPTAALTAGEVERLFEVMRKLAASGVGIVYISHRLEEVPEIADRVTVMRDGRVAGITEPHAPQAELVQLLVGRPLDELYPKRARSAGKALLSLRDASFRLARDSAGWQAPTGLSFDVHKGEIVGLAGIMGAGRTELLSALYGTGLSGHWEGDVAIGGRPVKLNSIKAARDAGIAYVTDDRRGSGLMLRMAVGLNLVMSVIRCLSPVGLMSPRRQADAVRQSFGQFDIRPKNPDIAVGALSGGNQQKVVLAKEILGNPRLLLLDEPTRGVDVGAKGEIYARLRQLAAQGLGILVASSEMPELIGLCDRIVVLRQGRNVAEFIGGIDEHTVLAAANGREA